MLDAEITGPVADPWGNLRIGLSATGKLNRKEFGLTWNVVTEAGGLLVGDDVKLSIDAEFVKAVVDRRGRDGRRYGIRPDARADGADGTIG